MSRIPLVLMLLIAILPAASDAGLLKIATIAPEGSVWMEEMRAAAAEIEQRTGGRVRLRFYPGGIMGNDNSVLRKIRIGQLQGGALTGGGLATIYPDVQVYNLPFAFRSYAEVDHVRRYMDEALVNGLRERGFVSFGLTEGGFAFMMASHSIKTVDDLAGHKVWVPEGDLVSRAGFEAINVSPVSLPLADVLTGLQTGLIDTVATTPVGAIALQWHTRVKYVNDTPLMYIFGALVFERKAFERLASGDQEIVAEVVSTAVAKLNAISREDEDQAKQALSGQGIQFVHSTEQQYSQWIEPVAQAMDRLARQGVFSPTVLRTLRRHLVEYRDAIEDRK